MSKYLAMNIWQPYFPDFDFVLPALPFCSFLRGYTPSKEQRNPRRDPHPSTSFIVTAEDVKLKRITHGSPGSRYSATDADLMIASPFSSPVHSPWSFSKWIKKLSRSLFLPSRIETRFILPLP